jgi:long-chain fatty acid transport protein
MAMNFTPKTILTLDLQKVEYSGVKAVANPLNNLINPSGCAGGNTQYCLGGSEGAGFGWRDMMIFKLGLQWEMSPDLIWRAGFSHGEQPIPESEVLFNILAPAVIEDHLTFGFTYGISAASELSFSFMHALENSVTGKNPLNPSQEVTLQMQQNEAEISWAWKF